MRRGAGLMLIAALSACDGGGRGDGPLWGDRPNEPIDLRGELSATEVGLLEPITIRLDLYVGSEVEVEFAPTVPPKFVGNVEAGPVVPFGDGEWRPFEVTLRPTELGELEIPLFEARVGEDGPAATTAEWTVTVGSVLGDTGAAVEAPAPPFDAEVELWPWFVGAGAVLLLLAVVLLIRRLRPERVEPAETDVPAHVKALRALGRLRNAPRATQPEVEAFYVDVSDVLRCYLEERFGLHAPERTTEEFLVEVEADARLDAAQRSALREFLAQCDLVKFARMVPTEATHARTFEHAEAFVEATREDRVREGAA